MQEQIKEAIARAKDLIAIEFEGVLIENAPVDTGFLKNNIHMQITDKGFSIKMPKYAYYTEFGYPAGTMPNVEALKGWSRRVLGDESLAWAVAMSIKQNGTKPQYWIREAFHRRFKEIAIKHIERELNKIYQQ